MGHYYTLDGDACHTQATKTGAKNKTRPTTVKDARKLKLLPSVTTVMEDITKGAFADWGKRNVLRIAGGIPLIDCENVQEWIGEILKIDNKERDDTFKFGTAIHHEIEVALNHGEWDEALNDYVCPALDAVWAMDLQEMATESVTVNSEIGYAGCVDLSGWMQDKESMVEIPTVPVIVDFKTKKTKVGEKIDVSETYPWQLAAYHVSKFGKGQREVHPLAKAALVFISSTEPGRVEIKWFDRAELEHAWECFKAAHKLWCLRNNYVLTNR